MATPTERFHQVLQVRHDVRKQLTRDLASQRPTDRERAAMSQTTTTPAKAIRN